MFYDFLLAHNFFPFFFLFFLRNKKSSNFSHSFQEKYFFYFLLLFFHFSFTNCSCKMNFSILFFSLLLCAISIFRIFIPSISDYYFFLFHLEKNFSKKCLMLHTSCAHFWHISSDATLSSLLFLLIVLEIYFCYCTIIHTNRQHNHFDQLILFVLQFIL